MCTSFPYHTPCNVVRGPLYVHTRPVLQYVADAGGTVHKPHVTFTTSKGCTETTNRMHKRCSVLTDVLPNHSNGTHSHLGHACHCGLKKKHHIVLLSSLICCPHMCNLHNKIQDDSVARGPKLLSIKNYVIEIMT